MKEAMTPERWKQIEQIYHQAQQCDARERAAFLDEACGADDELRNQVKSLLKADDDAESFLDTPALNLAAQMIADEQIPSLAGKRISHYEIVERIGAGGMGEVYLAKDIRLNRNVAIKVLPAHMSKNAEALARFVREARAVAALSHPNILDIHDFGNEDGLCYAVTELLEGETLRSRSSRSALSWREAVEIGVAVGDGLSAAHAKGIIHRDLKPENIFLLRDGGVKVLDFGLARVRVVGAAPADSTPSDLSVTEPGMVVGTVGYMSPEQVRGEKVEAASDIFSLGCVLYEMLAGRRAFAGETVAERMAAILRDEPSKLTDTRKDVPPQLEQVINRCLKKKPEERYQLARDLAFDLKAMLSGAEVSLSALAPARVGAQSQASWRALLTSRRVLAASALVMLVAAAALGYLLLFRSSRTAAPLEIKSLAVLPLENLSGDQAQEYFTDGMTDALITRLAQIGALRVISRTSVMQYKGARKPLPEIGRELKVDAVVEGSVLRAGERVRITAQLIHAGTDEHLWAETYERDLRDILTLQSEVARAIARQIAIKLTPKERAYLASAHPINPDLYELYLKGRAHWNKRGTEDLKKGIEYFQQAIEKDPNYALAYAGLADSYSVKGDYGDLPPKEVFPKARAAAMKALALDDTLAEAHTSLASVRTNYDWDWAGAESEYRRAIELNPNYATAHHWYARYLVKVGRHDEAFAEINRARELDPLSQLIKVNVGEIFYFAHEYDLAIEESRKMLKADPNWARAHHLLGRAYLQKGMLEEGLAEHQRAHTLASDVAAIIAGLGNAYGALGKRADAIKLLDRLRELSKQRYMPPYHLAMIHTGLDDKDRALEWLERGYQERDAWLLFLKVDARFDSLRSDPRFADLLQRMGLTP